MQLNTGDGFHARSEACADKLVKLLLITFFGNLRLSSAALTPKWPYVFVKITASHRCCGQQCTKLFQNNFELLI